MRNVFISLIATAALTVSSCSEWTETESIKIDPRPTPAESDPAGYAEYLADLRDYKNSDHKIMMVTVRSAEEPSRQNQHLMTLPDSIDYVMLKGVTRLGTAIRSEMREVKDQKGTKVFCVVDYVSIVDAWGSLWQGTADNPDAPDDRTSAEFADYTAEQTGQQLALYDDYEFDGVEISYLGNRSGEFAIAGQDAFIAEVTEWSDSHSDAEMVFRGYWNNLADKTILEKCTYLVGTPLSSITAAPSGKIEDDVAAMDAFFYNAGRLTDTPNDRMIYEVSIADINDPRPVGVSPRIAAAWSLYLMPERPATRYFEKRGIAVDNAQDDYFNVGMIYTNIRQAIGIMAAGEEQSL